MTETRNVIIGANSYYLKICSVYLGVSKRPNWFRRLMLKTLLGISVVSDEELKRETNAVTS